MRGVGNQSEAIRLIRSQVVRSFWLRRLSACLQRPMTWYRNAFILLELVGTAWYARKPITTLRSHLPCSGMDRCLCRLNSSLIFCNLARIRSRRVFLMSWNLPCVLHPQIYVNPRKLNVSGLPSPRSARL